MMKLSAEELLNKYSKSTSHSVEVRRLSLLIFDETAKKIKQMPARCREYLSAAALLHDIGYHIDSKSHNKHSMKMVMEKGLAGFSEREEQIVACICRYHRGSLPDKTEHEIYNTFDKKERKIVKRLAGILRIADGLDRGHLNLVKDIRLNFDEEHRIAEFMLLPRALEFLPDITTVVRKRDLFEIGFKCQCVIKLEV